MYLALGIGRQANRSSSFNFWDNGGGKIQQVFARQAIPMVWGFVESNPTSASTGGFVNQVAYMARVLKTSLPAIPPGTAVQLDAMDQELSAGHVVSTDPPYYDNIGYADLSDYFYVWLRDSATQVYPSLLSTMAVPKSDELVATPHRHANKKSAEEFFLHGMTRAIAQIAQHAHLGVPVTIYYAFKQAEAKSGVSTGWETFLDAVLSTGLSVNGTWPIRTEYTGNLKNSMNTLASSIILVCRPRPLDAAVATRGEFRRRLQAEFPEALRLLQTSNIAPVDLTQASIGPGMRIFTEYARVEKSDGTPMSVREALAMINETLDEVQVQQEGDFDADTRWAATWLDQHGFDLGDYGEAETLSKARNTSVAGLVEAGVVESRRGQVALILPEDLDPNWIPQTDSRKTVWEMTHHLIRVLETRGEREAGELMRQFQFFAESARDLAYRLYSISERHNRASDARRYNALIQSWPEIARLSREDVGTQQALLDGD